MARLIGCAETETGATAIIDFMPPTDGTDLVRIVTAESGRVTFQTEFVVRFNTQRKPTHPVVSKLTTQARALAKADGIFRAQLLALFVSLPFAIRDQRPYCSSLTFSIQSTGLPFNAS
jgi:hypothetical protein